MTSEYDIHCNEAVSFYDDDDYDALANEWRESQLKCLRYENETLRKERLDAMLMKPIWGAVGLAIGMVTGAFAMWLSFYFDGVTRQ